MGALILVHAPTELTGFVKLVHPVRIDAPVTDVVVPIVLVIAIRRPNGCTAKANVSTDVATEVSEGFRTFTQGINHI